MPNSLYINESSAEEVRSTSLMKALGTPTQKRRLGVRSAETERGIISTAESGSGHDVLPSETMSGARAGAGSVAERTIVIYTDSIEILIGPQQPSSLPQAVPQHHSLTLSFPRTRNPNTIYQLVPSLPSFSDPVSSTTCRHRTTTTSRRIWMKGHSTAGNSARVPSINPISNSIRTIERTTLSTPRLPRAFYFTSTGFPSIQYTNSLD